ncbi:MAG: PEP/pyruvate-binding domain-containing protein, partial [Mycobacteriaceae bacterium]
MPSQPPTTETRWVKPIDQVSSEDTPQVGGKAANLGELWHARFPVPSGFVVVADGYLDAVTEGGVRELLRVEFAPGRNAAYKDLSELAESRASLIRELAVPPQMRAEIVSAYRNLGDSVRVAVRSSAPAEDGADTSFAGIHESYTNVIGDDAVVDAVRKCWVSLWSERALSYRSERSLGEEPSIAVVVQTMVDADCAGVVFTADPRTGARDHVVIEAARGLGEVVVGGQVEPDVYEVAKADFRVLAVHLGAQAFEITSGDSGDKRVELTDD